MCPTLEVEFFTVSSLFVSFVLFVLWLLVPSWPQARRPLLMVWAPRSIEGRTLVSTGMRLVQGRRQSEAVARCSAPHRGAGTEGTGTGLVQGRGQWEAVKALSSRGAERFAPSRGGHGRALARGWCKGGGNGRLSQGAQL